MPDILVVDDNEEFCESMKDILELEGFKVLTAYSGLQAITAVKKQRPDFILMDILMPEMNGIIAFKNIKQIAPDTPVIMMSAYSVEETIKDALRAGAFGYARKPVDIHHLISIFRDALQEMRILVVDDDRELCVNLKEIFSEKGYSVALAYNGYMALERTRERNFDAVLIDMKLPSLNGLETYLAIHEVRPEARAIMMTGYPDEMSELAEQAVREEAYAWLKKPIDLRMAISILEETRAQKLRKRT